MKSNAVWFLLLHTLLLFLGVSIASSSDGIYIVYMGAADSSNASLRSDHDQILNFVQTRNENAIVRIYKHGFSGFAARLTKEEADIIAQKPGVVSVFPDSILKLHTTHSWDFIKYQTHVKIDAHPNDASDPSSSSSLGSDTIIGLLDTGITPEAPSFNDEGFKPIPARWKGMCVEAKDFNSSNCNRKLIGARYYHILNADDTPRDAVGHGTHTASTAAGVTVTNVSYFGLAPGNAKGGSPKSRLAVYRVCTDFGCPSSAILAAFDDAIADGVDILSLSLGGNPYYRENLTSDPILIGAFHAMERGIMVVCSAGNYGPFSKTVMNDAPWILTVAANTIDRDFVSNVILGGNKVVKGKAINFSPLSTFPRYSLIYGESAKSASANATEARQCHPNSLDKSKVKGKIVICDGRTDDLYYSTYSKIETVKDVGAIGLVHITDQKGAQTSSFGDLPATEINPKDAGPILEYVNSTSNPMGTILPTKTVLHHKPAPVVVQFSSRGPSGLSSNILKPDITAPGVNILAAWRPNDPSEVVPKGQKPLPYDIVSGTSMACPHVSGLAGTIKSRYPTWSPSAIKSAIMTTAIQTNNLKAPITTDSGKVATPYDIGAGHITTIESLQPGLVYETSTIDYLNYLCYIGLNITTIRVISRTVPDHFRCPKDSSSDQISNINYPSIAISNFSSKGVVTVTRTVANIGGEDETEYSPVVYAPVGVNVKLIPEKLQFTASSKKLSYQIVFSSTSTLLEEHVFGSITWSNGKHSVRSPFVLTN